MYFYLDYTMRSDAGCTSTDLGLRISQFIKSVVVSVWLRGWKQSLACGLDSSRSRKTVGNAINTRIRMPWRNRGKQQGGKLYFVVVLMNQFLCTDFMKPCHRTLSLCMWATICEQQETLIAKMWSAWESQYLFSLFFFPLVSKHCRVQDILSTDPQDLQKSFNHQQDLHCVPLVDAVNALLLPLAPFINLLLIYKSQPKPMFTVRSLSQLYIWFLLLPLECWVLYVNPQINMHRFYLISQLVEWL